ncbi:helix-turn-helix domain-containing protein [Methylobacterium currus]|uniref:helix-turn-helix domain-containing protein n=1 Tax=Methylobacterium currus TaxID=2051553 RepID=UPI001E485500|nr:helix-turn-helix domain-containing protein [Methylobacterium currus]UHC17161.1 helix-turn-helix domain-containing protein [Methylobacterium currus]
MASDIPVDRFVAHHDPDASLKSWIEHIEPVFEVRSLPGTHVGPSVKMQSYNLGTVLVGEISAPTQALERTARKAAIQGLDHVLIQFYESGSSLIRTDRSEATVSPSDFVVYDLSQPVAVSSSAVTATNILLPRALLGNRTGLVSALHGSVFSTAHDKGAELFACYLRRLVASCDDLDAHHVPNLAEAAASLCATALPNWAADGVAERRATLKVRAFIHDNLGTPELGPEMICARFGLSRATLYRQFAADDGVQNYIRNCRLAQAMRLLTEPAEEGRPRISSIAYATGFSDDRSFSRAFKRRYGCLPRDAAAERAAGSPRVQPDDTLGDWIRRLGL